MLAKLSCMSFVRKCGLRAFSNITSPLAARLAECDPEIFDIIEQEKRRQRESLVLIPSENFTSTAVLEALGSVMQNKYSEGYPNARYYGGNEFIDMAELACQKRALETFRLDPEKWGVNVQSLSGSPANFEVYTAVLKPHERMMALDLPHGGHLSHGYQTATKKISAVSIYFECLPYRLDEQTGLIDYDTLEKNAILYRPKLLVCGASAYSRHIDYGRMRHVANINNSYLMTDMAHISGLVAAGVMPSPFDHSDIVTTTAHKSLRGPRGAMIFYRKGVRSTDKNGKMTAFELEDAINGSVFPGHQGGPHNHTITALAVALKQAQTPAYRQYQEAVLKNCQALCKRFQTKGYTIVSGGTDNHLFMVDVRHKGLNGAKVEKVLELCNIAINKNTVPGDKSALTPGGIRMGTPALTTRGFGEKDFERVADLMDAGINIALQVNQKAGVTSTLKTFNAALTEVVHSSKDMSSLKSDVISFARKFPVVGFNQGEMKYSSEGI